MNNTGQETSSASSDSRANEEKINPAANADSAHRKYETTGCYPDNGKSFRMWALFGWLTGVMVALAAAAALLNYIFLGTK
jgi:hypothetical protein